LKILVDVEKQSHKKSEDRKRGAQNSRTNFSLREESKLKAPNESEVV
jgi:hypothetical protein